MEQWTAAHDASVISSGDVPWSARSPELSVRDYSLEGGRGVLQRDIDELKIAIKGEITVNVEGSNENLT
jgi:hypothetical protein